MAEHTQRSDLPVPDRDTLIAEWTAAVRTQIPLGACPRPGCDGVVRATPPVVTPGVVWLEAECDACHCGVAQPNGKRREEPAAGPRSRVQVLTGGVRLPDGARDWREVAYKD
jgi:hypothetical protein